MVLSVQKKCITILIYIYICWKRVSCNCPCQFPNVLARPRPWMVDLEIKMTKAQRESCKERSTEKDVVKVKKQGGKVSVHIVFISTDASEQGIYFIYIYIYIFGYTSFYL